MIINGDTSSPGLKHHGRRTVVRERYQRPEVRDLGNKWKLGYWDYSSPPRRKRSKVWAKSLVPSRREAQRLADQFMEKVNERNNDPSLHPTDNENFHGLVKQCRDKLWMHYKKPTRIQYDYFLKCYLLPAWGNTKLTRLRLVELQDYFNSFHPRLGSQTIRLMHGCMRSLLNYGKSWGLLKENPAVGVKLPRKKKRKHSVLLSPADMQRMIDASPEPTKSILTLIVLGSMRVGEALAVRRQRVLSDRIQIVERLYDNDFDDVKTEAGEREVPLDELGIMRSALDRIMKASAYKQPMDLVFTNRKGGPLNRRNLLRRQLKPTAVRLGLSPQVDFRSFRTMHGSLMLRIGARAEVVRDNMGHSDVDVTQNIYGKSWWEERVNAVTLTAAMVWPRHKKNQHRRSRKRRKPSRGQTTAKFRTARNGSPFGSPRKDEARRTRINNGRGERI
jgi:integrase